MQTCGVRERIDRWRIGPLNANDGGICQIAMSQDTKLIISKLMTLQYCVWKEGVQHFPVGFTQ